MFTPHSLGIALFMMIASAICWGSWANTYKGVKNYRFELFYWDYAVGIFLVSLILAFTMGSTGNDASSFLNNVRSADTNNIVSVMIGGAIFGFQLGTWFSVAMIGFAGVAVLYDTSNIIHNYPEDRYVSAAMQLFASIALMFWYVLRLIMGNRS